MDKIKITLEEAKKLSILKWEKIIEKNGMDLCHIEIMELGLGKLINECGYCEYFIPMNRSCTPCLISLGLEKSVYGWSCCNPEHPFKHWLAAQYPFDTRTALIYAKKVLKLIKES